MPTICLYDNLNYTTTQQIHLNDLFLKNIKAEIDIHTWHLGIGLYLWLQDVCVLSARTFNNYFSQS